MNLRGQDGDIWELLDYRFGSQEKVISINSRVALIELVKIVVESNTNAALEKTKLIFCAQVAMRSSMDNNVYKILLTFH